MKKPNSLKDYLLASIPPLKHNPDGMQIFIDQGNLSTLLRANLHFEYRYTLNLILTDWANHPNTVLVPMLAWLKIHQPDLDPEAVSFEVDILRDDLVDLSISLPLTERVLVSTDNDGNYLTNHADEPQPEENLPEPALFKTLYAEAGAEQLTPEPLDPAPADP